MYQTRSGYDRGVNTFSPEGRLFQVEYAIKAIELGSCAIGVCTSEGVVLAAEKRITSRLLEESSVEKVFEVDSHIGAAISGLTADATTLVEHARVDSQNHRFTYDEPMPLESLTQSISDIAMSFGEGGDEARVKMSRPFGVAMLLGGSGTEGTRLYSMDPSGTYIQYAAHAIGNGSETARSMLEERYNKSMTLHDAKVLVLRILTETMEDKVTSTNVDVATVTPGEGYSMLASDELSGLIEAAQAQAREEGER